MSIIDEIITTLLLSSPGDLRAVRQYIGWMKMRRVVNGQFYFRAHWVQRSPGYHWI